MPDSPTPHQQWTAAVRRHLDDQDRSITWLGKEVARIEGRAQPYAQPTVSGHWFTVAPPDPETVFAIERALLLRPGTLSRILGYVPASARSSRSVRDAIAEDPGLSDAGKRALLAAYEQLVDHGTSGT